MATETGAVTGAATLEKPKRRIDPIELLGRFAPVIFLIVLAVIFTSQQPAFASERNFWFLLRQNFVYGILAVGMTFVILTGGIDLSVGSVLAFAGLVAAAVAKGSNWRDVGNPDAGGIDVLWGALAAIGVGAGAGLIHGFAIAKLKVPAFVVTLGGLAAWRGAAQVMSEGTPINRFSDDYRYWGSQFLGRVPVPVVIFALFIVAGHGYELIVIAAVVIGGTSLFGGEGSVLGTLVGTLLIGVLNNGLQINNVNPYYQPIIIGLIVVLSVYLDQLAKRRRRA